MRLAIALILAATGGLVWWLNADSDRPAREVAEQKSVEPEKVAEPPPRAEPEKQPPRADVAELRRKLADPETHGIDAIRELEKLGPAAADAIPELAARLVAFAKSKEEYEKANPMVHVSWIHVDYRVGDALVAIGEASIPALIELLGSEYQDARWTAMRSLQSLIPKSIPALIDARRDPNANRRAGAASALEKGAKTNPEIFDVLRALLEDPEPDVRRAAIRSIGVFGADAAPLLIAKLGGPDAYTAADAFSDYPDAARAAVMPIARALQNPKARNRMDLAYALVRIGKDAAPAVAILAGLLDDEDEFAAERIVNALANCGEAAIGPLQAAMGSDDAIVRARATEALSRIDGAREALVPAYHRMLSSENKKERETAAVALARQGAHIEDAAPVLEELLRGEDYERSKDALIAIRQYQEDAAAAMALVFRFVALEGPRSEKARYSDFWRSQMHEEIPKTLRALGVNAPGDLAAGLHSNVRQVRTAAYEALLKSEASMASHVFVETKSKMALGRAKAIRLLGVIAKEDPRTAAAVQKGLKDPAWQVRAAAAGTLWAIAKNARQSLPVLIEALGHMPKSGEDYYDAHEIEELARPLGTFGKHSAFAATELSALAKDAPNQHVRWQAGQAAKQLAAPPDPK